MWTRGRRYAAHPVGPPVAARSGWKRTSEINYVPTAGGGELIPTLLSGDAAAGVSGTSEFAGQVESGDFGLLAVSSPDRIDGIDAPTIEQASSLPVTVSNWRGMVAAQNTSPEDEAAIVAMIRAVGTSS